MKPRDKFASAKDVRAALQRLADPEKAKLLSGFFKTGPGEYGEGDQFWGITVPVVRKTALAFIALPLSEVSNLLADPIHEVRFAALSILVAQYEKRPAEREKIVDFYVAHTQYINNWDLVDLSAPKIIGDWALRHSRIIIWELSFIDPVLWVQRIAVVSTLTLIRADEFKEIFWLADFFHDHPHDLMHKAIGWMLREVGKRDKASLDKFLAKHAHRLPRTALRYAIERHPPAERQRWLAVKRCLDKPTTRSKRRG